MKKILGVIVLIFVCQKCIYCQTDTFFCQSISEIISENSIVINNRIELSDTIIGNDTSIYFSIPLKNTLIKELSLNNFFTTDAKRIFSFFNKYSRITFVFSNFCFRKTSSISYISFPLLKIFFQNKILSDKVYNCKLLINKKSICFYFENEKNDWVIL